jgi:hypothetical protein
VPQYTGSHNGDAGRAGSQDDHQERPGVWHRLLPPIVGREFLTEEESMDHLRRQGFDEVRNVQEACIEGEGKITVIGRMQEKQ